MLVSRTGSEQSNTEKKPTLLFLLVQNPYPTIFATFLSVTAFLASEYNGKRVRVWPFDKFGISGTPHKTEIYAIMHIGLSSR